MKALIISDEKSFIDCMDSFFQSHGADTIIYKWLLKAIDNIEEIRPNVIVLSSAEYPRHWKTLVQFVKSGIGGDDVDIFLYEPNQVSEEDKEKIKLLGITGVFTSLEQQSLKIICPIFGDFISKTKEVVEPSAEQSDEAETMPSTPKVEATVEAEIESTIEATVEAKVESMPAPSDSLIFSHPLSMAFVTGKIDSKEENLIYFTTDFEQQLKDIKQGMNTFATLQYEDDCTTVPVQINSIENEKICFEVNYEEK